MTEERAREIFEDWVKIRPDGELDWFGEGPFIRWRPGNIQEATLDGDFTVEQVEAIAFWMRLRMKQQDPA